MDDERWTWWDNRFGVPGEDERIDSTPVMTYTPATFDPDRIKAMLATRRAANPAPVRESWARKLGRRIANSWAK